MKNLTRVFGLLLVASFLGGCGGVEGILSVSSAFNLQDKSGKVTTVPAGDFNISLAQARNSISIEFQRLNGARKKVTIKTPDNFKLPQNGNFQLSAAETGQEVNINGSVTTRTERSEERWQRESCNYTNYETVCSPAPNGTVTCSTQPVIRWGYRDARFYYLVTKQELQVHFTGAKTDDVKATFLARTESTQRVDLYTSRCF